MTTRLLLALQSAAPHWRDAYPNELLLGEPDVPQWQIEGSQFRWQQVLPTDALHRLCEILPSLALQTDASWGYQCALEYETSTGHSALSYLAPIGDFSGEEREDEPSAAVRADVDIWRVEAPLKSATLHWYVQCRSPIADLPALLSVSLRAVGAPPAPVPVGGRLAHDVPMRSQMQLRSDIANRVCSPTSVSMLLDYYGKSVDVYDFIDEAQHGPSGLYGVWPANVHAAARRGLMGYLLHIPRWEVAKDLLDAGFPLIASVRYAEGELGDGAVRKTNGHLLVVRGYDGDRALVNDPAAACDEEVARSYDLSELCTVWLGRSAVSYVLFTP